MRVDVQDISNSAGGIVVIQHLVVSKLTDLPDRLRIGVDDSINQVDVELNGLDPVISCAKRLQIVGGGTELNVEVHLIVDHVVAEIPVIPFRVLIEIPVLCQYVRRAPHPYRVIQSVIRVQPAHHAVMLAKGFQVIAGVAVSSEVQLTADYFFTGRMIIRIAAITAVCAVTAFPGVEMTDLVFKNGSLILIIAIRAEGDRLIHAVNRRNRDLHMVVGRPFAAHQAGVAIPPQRFLYRGKDEIKALGAAAVFNGKGHFISRSCRRAGRKFQTGAVPADADNLQPFRQRLILQGEGIGLFDVVFGMNLPYEENIVRRIVNAEILRLAPQRIPCF